MERTGRLAQVTQQDKARASSKTVCPWMALVSGQEIILGLEALAKWPMTNEC